MAQKDFESERWKSDFTHEGKKFEFERWGASEAFRVYNKLAAIFGIPAMALFSQSTGKQDVIGMLSTHLLDKGEEGLSMLKKLTSKEGGVLWGGTPIVFDDFYAGQLELAIDVAIENYGVQFPSLTQNLQKKMDQLRPKDNASPSPKITGKDAESKSGA